MRNHSYKNDFDLRENKTACRTHFHIKGFALRPVLKQRQRTTRKWPFVHEDCILSILNNTFECKSAGQADSFGLRTRKFDYKV